MSVRITVANRTKLNIEFDTSEEFISQLLGMAVHKKFSNWIQIAKNNLSNFIHAYTYAKMDKNDFFNQCLITNAILEFACFHDGEIDNIILNTINPSRVVASIYLSFGSYEHTSKFECYYKDYTKVSTGISF